MNLTVLVDNNTILDEYYIGEHGLSFYIEDNDKKILFDLGYSNVLLENMKKLNIKSEDIDILAISHGHDDHVGGIKYFANKKLNKNLEIIAHPLTFNKKIKKVYNLNEKENNFSIKYQCISSPLDINEIENMGSVKLSKNPIKISENIYFMGEIPNVIDFEKRYSMGKINIGGEYIEDFIYEDSALVYKSDEGLFIISGCAHSGICNIIEYAKKIFNEDRIIGIIGGTYLIDVDDRTKQTLKYFEENNIKNLYLCHCTSFRVKSFIDNVIPLKEVGVGMKIKID